MTTLSERAKLFRLQFYKWAKQDALREVQENFPFLRLIKDSTAWRVVALMESLQESERVQLALSLVKSIAGEEILSLVDDSCTEVDIEWQKKFSEACYINPITYDIEEEFLLKVVSGEISLRLNKKQFKALLQKELHSILGKKLENHGSVWRYRMEIEDWKVDTEIDIGGSFQLRYHHTIHSAIQDDFVLKPRIIDFLGWLGMGDTAWQFLTSEEMELAAKTVASLCSHFLHQAPRLLGVPERSPFA